MKIKNLTTKFISTLLIIGILMPSVFLSIPKKTEAAGLPVVDIVHNITSIFNGIFQSTTAGSTVVDTGLHIKDFAIEIGKQLLKIAAKRLLAQMTQSTINWINSGFHGSPLFLENPDSFFKDIAKTEVKNLVDMIGYDTFRFPFGRQTALNVISSYQNQLAINAQYSLSKVINDPDLLVRYRNDFNYGGWNGFLINTQYPQNNYLGFNMIIQENLAKRLEGTLQAPAQKVQTALQQGMGFLSPQVCPSNPSYPASTNPYNPPRFNAAEWERQNPYNPATGAQGSLLWSQARDAAKIAFEAQHSCPGGLVATTPGTVVANQIISATNTPFLTTALDGALGNSIAAIFDALLNKLIGDGLNSLKTTVNPSGQTDNWSYQGYTLGGGNTGGAITYGDSGGVTTTTTGPLLINSQSPQNVLVSANVNETSIATISGGSGPYAIQTGSNEAVAVVVLSGTGLIVSGVSAGETYVVIKDSGATPRTARVNIRIIGPSDLVFDPEDASVNVGESVNVGISGGTAPYIVVTPPENNIATIPDESEIADNTLAITGVAAGETAVIIKDSSYPAQIGRTIITVTDPDNPTGNCVINGTINTGVTESSCQSSDGTWSPTD